MKILLIYPNNTKLPWYFKYIIDDTIKDTLPPLGMLYVIANSRSDIDFIDNRIKKYDLEQLFEICLNYDIIGFGGTIFEVNEAQILSKKLMEAGKITLYGGANATVNWKLYLNDFSSIVIGEAENLFNFYFKNKSDKIFKTIRCERNENLDKLIYPARHKIDLNDYRRNERYLEEKPVDTVVSSRGCPYDCSFCSSKHIWDRKYTYRSVNNVLEEIKYLQNIYKTKAIYFREDNFTINIKRLVEFCDKMTIPWMCESRADLTEETIKRMKEGGCKAIWFGIEATDNETLKRIKKNITIEKAKKTIELCNKHGVKTGGGFIFGFPTDSKRDIIKRFKDSNKLGLWNTFYNRFYAIPYSDLYQEVKDNNLDQLEFQNIILPRTYFINAYTVNWLYFNLAKRNYLIKQWLFGQKNKIKLFIR